MTTEEAIQAILIASPSLTVLCPASRILVPGTWQNLDRPYIIHFPVTTSTAHTHSEGLVLLRIHDYYQVSVIAASYSGARTVADVVISTLDGTHSGLTAFYLTEIHIPEPDTESHQIALNFRVAYAPS